jgi:benzoyl-CoA reductase/2-hydroxyglutaryl-CoA dehydratase subunit BcrC/BadD/HgdB
MENIVEENIEDINDMTERLRKRESVSEEKELKIQDLPIQQRNFLIY